MLPGAVGFRFAIFCCLFRTIKVPCFKKVSTLLCRFCLKVLLLMALLPSTEVDRITGTLWTVASQHVVKTQRWAYFL